MKHIVTLTISNPSHEHVSLRRRQSTTNYMVEARDEAEAIFRASNHFKKLGNYVHNAVIAESVVNEEYNKNFPLGAKMKDAETAHRTAASDYIKAHGGRTPGAHAEAYADATVAHHYGQEAADKIKSSNEKIKNQFVRKPQVNEAEQIDELDAGKGSILDRATKVARSKFKLSDINVRGTGMSKKTRDAHDRYTRLNFKLNQANAAKRAADASGTKYSDEYVSNIKQGKEWHAAVAKVKADRKAASDAKKAAKMTKEEVEQIDEVGDTPSGLARLKNVQARADHTMDSWSKNPKFGYSSTPPEVKKATKTSVRASNRINRDPTTGKPFAYASLKKEEVEQIDEGNKENKAKKNTYVANIIKKKLSSQVLPSLKFGRRELKKEEVEQVSEVLKPSMGASAYIHHFVHSDNPEFAGKTKAERTKMALGAFYAAKKGK